MCKTPEDLDLQGIDTVAIDIETYDPNLKSKGLGAIRFVVLQLQLIKKLHTFQ